jgi:hypothetical protein
MSRECEQQAAQSSSKWEPMRLVYVGHVGKILATTGVGKSPGGPDVDNTKGGP